jgi:hypothetical protein
VGIGFPTMLRRTQRTDNLLFRSSEAAPSDATGRH